MPAVTAGSREAPVGSPSQVLAEAAKHIEAETQWFAALGLPYEEGAERAGDVAVETVLAFSVVSGLVDAANAAALAPVFVVLKGLLGSFRGAAAAREDMTVIELIQYCVGISRCLLEAAKAGDDMPRPLVETLGEFKGEAEAVGRFVQTHGTRPRTWCGRISSSSHDRDTAAWHRKRLKVLLDAALAGLSAQAHRGVKDLPRTLPDAEPPRPHARADIPRGAPTLPTTYAQRTVMLRGVVADLTDSHRSASAAHCLLGRGGVGKTLMASSVVRDDRVRASFKDGVFWVTVGREGKDVALLLEHLAVELEARAPADKKQPNNACPDRFNGAGEVLRHLSAVRKQNGLRCLVVLDNVWDVEVVDAFASTGFHVLATTRERAVMSPAHSGVCTVVGDMLTEDALEVLRKASGADGPIPTEEARKVARDCGMLPMALGMAGTLAKKQPLDPASWRTVHEKLREKRAKFRGMDNGRLFSVIDASLCDLPSAQQEQLRLMAVMASGVVATSEMLANLWKQHITEVPTGASVLVNRYLLQDQLDGYRVHDLVLQFLQLTIGVDGGRLARKASSRQARYLAKLRVFKQYNARGAEVSAGGLYSLVALWIAVKRLDGAVDVEACYRKSLEGKAEVEITRQVAWVLLLLGSYAGAEAMLRDTLTGAEEQDEQLVEVGYALSVLAGALKEQGKYAEADPIYVRVIEAMEKALGPDHPNVALCLHNRTLLLSEQGRYDEADRLYLRCIAIEERTLGPGHPQLAQSLNTRADILRAKGKLDEADSVLARAIKIQERAFGPNHPSLANSLGARAIVLEAQGKYDEADRLCVRRIKIQEKALSPDNSELAASLHDRADLLRAQGKLREADLLLARAITIQERALGSDHASLANTLDARATVLSAQGKLDEADPLLEKAIEIQERALGPDHPNVALSLGGRAMVLQAQGKFEEADRLYVKSIEIEETTLGPDHPQLAGSLNSRAGLLEAQGKLDQARSLLERALAIQRRSVGEGEHQTTQMVLDGLRRLDESQGKTEEEDPVRAADSLKSRAEDLANQGKYNEADRVYQRAIDVQENRLGLDHPRVADVLDLRASLQRAQGKFGEADLLYRKSIRIKEKAPEVHPLSLADTLNSRAMGLHVQRSFEEAEPLVVRAIGIEENEPGPDRPNLACYLDTLAELKKAQGKCQEADPLYLRAIDVFEQTIGRDHPVLAETLHNRAASLKAQGNYGEARPTFERALAIRKKKLGEGHKDTVQTLEALRDLHESQHVAQVPGTE
eukprot:g13139.t2